MNHTTVKIAPQSINWNALRQQTDSATDAVIEEIANEKGRGGVADLMRWLANTKDWNIADQSEVLQQFWLANQSLPTWVEHRKMQGGMAFFRKYQATIGLLLGCLSLPYCYAAADGAQVLYLSQRIQQDTRKRLEETGEFVFSVMKQSAWRTGEAIRRILKVRLMHAAIRYFTLHSGRWHEVWGQPINQEDMAGTNLSFSYIVIRGMRKSNINFGEQEAENYLYLWNVIGALMGVQDEMRPQNLREAYLLDKTIAKRQFKPSEAGQLLAKSLRTTLEDFMPSPLLKSLPTAQMRFLLGDEIADLLALPAVPLEKRLVQLVPMQIFFRE